MKPPHASTAYPQVHTVRLVWLAAFVSVFSFLYYQRHGEILLYGDAVAHINIARRVFDSKTPGLLQLGTVWLPLPHLLMLPFIVPMKLWQSGTGGSIPSMAGYILGVLGMFRLGRGVMNSARKFAAGRIVPWAAAIIYGGNPNLIYMQATAMGESLYLAFFIWAVVFFAEFARASEVAGNEAVAEAVTVRPGIGKGRSLIRCGFCLLGACLTRYDGWFLAVLIVIAVMVVSFRTRAAKQRAGAPQPASPSALLKFILLAAAGPILWLAYNAVVYRNPLEFANGPYSAKAIEQRTQTVNPAKGNLAAAFSYFLKAAQLNVANAVWLGRLWLGLALIGGIASLFMRGFRPALFLWVPLLFYASCIAYGSVTIFVPAWWPFSFYNLRYGLQFLPAFALFTAVAIALLVPMIASYTMKNTGWRRWEGAATLLIVIVLVVGSYGAIWKTDPICYREAFINSRGRIALDTQLVKWLSAFPKNSTLLMYLGEHSGALEQAGIPLRRVINEGNHRVWRQPGDPQGLWERGLADPAKFADFVIGFEGDPVWKSARAHGLTAIVEIHTTGQAAAAIFQGKAQAGR